MANDDDALALFRAFFASEDDYLALLRRMRHDDGLLRRAVRVMCADARVDADRVLHRVFHESTG